MVAEETDNPDRFAPGARFCVAGQTLTVEHSRRTAAGLLVKFVSRDDRDAVEGLRGVAVTIPEAERRPLGPDEFWVDELIGFDVRDTAGARLGEVVGFVEGVGQDRLVVSSPDGRVFDVPFVAALVPEVSREGRFLVVVPLDGLFDDPG